MVTETGYHGTKRSSAEAIIRDGFIIKKPSPGSKKRKYGAGAYFFREEPDGYLAASRWAVKCFAAPDGPVVLKSAIEYDGELAVDFDKPEVRFLRDRYLAAYMEKNDRTGANQAIESKMGHKVMSVIERKLNERRKAAGKEPARIQAVLGAIDFIGDGSYDEGLECHLAPAIVVKDANLIHHEEASILPCRREAYE